MKPQRAFSSCPRCNHTHEASEERKFAYGGSVIVLDKCPYCECPLVYDWLRNYYLSVPDLLKVKEELKA